MITDEMVEKAYASLLSDEHIVNSHTRIRAMLEAVAPMIAAQTIQRVIDQLYKDGHLSARAQELDPK